MSDSVDLSELHAATREAVAELRGIPQAMGRIGRDAAKTSQRTHDYQNRTGDAERKTKCIVEGSSDSTFMLVTIDVPYASYLMEGGSTRRGSSLTGLEDAITTAETQLDYYFDGLGRGIR